MSIFRSTDLGRQRLRAVRSVDRISQERLVKCQGLTPFAFLLTHGFAIAVLKDEDLNRPVV